MATIMRTSTTYFKTKAAADALAARVQADDDFDNPFEGGWTYTVREAYTDAHTLRGWFVEITDAEGAYVGAL